MHKSKNKQQLLYRQCTCDCICLISSLPHRSRAPAYTYDKNIAALVSRGAAKKVQNIIITHRSMRFFWITIVIGRNKNVINASCLLIHACHFVSTSRENTTSITAVTVYCTAHVVASLSRYDDQPTECCLHVNYRFRWPFLNGAEIHNFRQLCKNTHKEKRAQWL